MLERVEDVLLLFVPKALCLLSMLDLGGRSVVT